MLNKSFSTQLLSCREDFVPGWLPVGVFLGGSAVLWAQCFILGFLLETHRLACPTEHLKKHSHTHTHTHSDTHTQTVQWKCRDSWSIDWVKAESCATGRCGCVWALYCFYEWHILTTVKRYRFLHEAVLGHIWTVYTQVILQFPGEIHTVLWYISVGNKLHILIANHCCGFTSAMQ